MILILTDIELGLGIPKTSLPVQIGLLGAGKMASEGETPDQRGRKNSVWE